MVLKRVDNGWSRQPGQMPKAALRSAATNAGTTVVTHAAKRGARTSTRAPGRTVLDILDMTVLLLFKELLAEHGEPRQGSLAECYATRTARLLSSCNNNRNNPQRGTDRLRGAW
ncbi:hypothetical protein JDV09_09440 [Mycobacterium sp. Y57]|nr:hypothetical protein [Mycolicibacterium xanthum]MBX7432329.1 hypothetical protein [Mycolicibacterium xanthum]